MGFFANIFGYVLKFLYDIVNNYGVAIILFSILIKVLMIPITYKQQKTLKKNEKMQKELKQIQFKYKNDPEKLNQEMMSLYKREGMSPFSGCFSAIIQFVLLISVFMLVRSPLTYMVKLDSEVIDNLSKIVVEEDSSKNNAYKEIAIIQYVQNVEDSESVNKEEEITEENTSEESNTENNENSSTSKNNKDFDINKYKEQVNLNMNFLGIDLTQVPTQNLSDWKTLVIPILYVISSFVSIRLTTNSSKKKKMNNLITDGENVEEEEKNPMQDANKTMVWMMPIMSISIAIIAPLGLALYWLMNNILMIVERLVFNEILKKEEEAKQDA